MKILKYVLIGLLAIVAIFLIIGLFVPTTFKMERSVIINASQDIVRGQVVSLKNQHEWSPWTAYDPNMKTLFEGTDGAVGSIYSWEGNKDVGKGSQEITSVTENRVEMKVTFIEPWESVATSYIQLDSEGDSIKVTWGFEGSNPYPWNVMSLFVNMDEMVGNDFQKGLNNLKERAEKISEEQPKTYRGYEIKEVSLQPKVFLAKKGVVGFDQMSTFFAENLQAISGAIIENGLETDGHPCGIFYKWMQDTQTTEMAVGIPVAIQGEKTTLPKQFERIDMPAGKVLCIVYYGSYENSETAHYAMDDYIKENNLEVDGPVVEEYVTGPETETDPNKWRTNIYYAVK